VDGNIKLKIRAGTEPGTMMRLKGRGITNVHGHGKGDEYVKINIVVPEKLTREQKSLVEELKDLGL
jgi:molecular chaperone DnaJ